MLFTGWEVRIGRNCAPIGLSTALSLRPRAVLNPNVPGVLLNAIRQSYSSPTYVNLSMKAKT